MSTGFGQQPIQRMQRARLCCISQIIFLNINYLDSFPGRMRGWLSTERRCGLPADTGSGGGLACLNRPPEALHVVASHFANRAIVERARRFPSA
ncbi:MAG: hypothetical protein L0H23_00460 [Luteimonas sp.]|nr:hypothetical protein [Luteimonas sp.]